MQPYLFPYIGYFQLLNTADKFIFYDDVNCIKRGWINRTNILNSKDKQLNIVSISKKSQNTKINKTKLHGSRKDFLKSIHHNYRKAPHFNEIFELIEECFNKDYNTISELAAATVICVKNYLEIETDVSFSSKDHSSSVNAGRNERIIEICKKEKADIYINSIGGQELYSKEYFSNHSIDLLFLQTGDINYSQFPIRSNSFEPNLSILDVLMFNNVDRCKKLLKEFTLI